MITALPKSLDDLASHARRDAPDECCGLLIGTHDRIEASRPARNLRRSPTRYLIDPADHFEAIRTARLVGLEVVGVYHSHPASPPIPSETDRRAADPTLLYVIVSLLTDTIQAYRVDDGCWRMVPLVSARDVDG